MLYRLLKKVNHSLRTVFSFSSRSYQSGLQSSGLSDEVARALEGSFPAKTVDWGSTRLASVGASVGMGEGRR